MKNKPHHHASFAEMLGFSSHDVEDMPEGTLFIDLLQGRSRQSGMTDTAAAIAAAGERAQAGKERKS